ncbi:hypothetical protein PU02_1092 [Bartonella ancashensis]|uniref:Uncharacterized protein n=1 Tax=Bartonella ancashensis TaxID=1318743 RepID=A0A0M4LJC8_9HYPH|nr:hypothetical protein PU02_1092 [Bartonella ancashensis]
MRVFYLVSSIIFFARIVFNHNLHKVIRLSLQTHLREREF